MNSVIRLGVYLGIGALLHAFFIGSHFDWSSAWTWGWLLGWPVMLIFTLWTIVAAGIVITLVFLGGIALWEKL